MKAQRGGFAIGLVVGLLLGLALALGVALYITRAPVPFINKVPGRTSEQDNAEAERNKNWDPNAPLATKRAAGDAGPASGAASGALPGTAPFGMAPGAASTAAAGAGARPGGRDPAAILSGAPGATGAPGDTAARSTVRGADAFVYFVQAGAFTRTDDAEQQRARLAIMGHTAKVTEREQAGRTVYRVRMGPFATRGEADALQVRLQGAGVESQLVRVEKP